MNDKLSRDEILQIEFKIISRDGVRSKPRMTRQDKWLKPPRKKVSQWMVWQTDIIHAYWDSVGIVPPFADSPVALGCIFYLHKETQDLDNLIKGIKDALSGNSMAWTKDTVKYIPEYDKMAYKPLSKSQKEYVVVTIRKVEKQPYGLNLGV